MYGVLRPRFWRSNLCFSLRTISINSSSPSKNHYDVLGLKPRATQAEIKTAYYKLSLKFHPDMNKGSQEASDKFREVTDAYEILGNTKLRALYDKGAVHIHTHDIKSEPPIDKETKQKFYDAYAQSKFAGNTPVFRSRNEIYNFDEWTKAHYKESFTRNQMEEDVQAARKKMVEMHKISLISVENVFLGIICVGITISLILNEFADRSLSKMNYDTPQDTKIIVPDK